MKLRDVALALILLLVAACGSESEEVQPAPSPNVSSVKVIEGPFYECVDHADCELTTLDKDGCTNYTLFGELCSESKIYVVNQVERERRENLEMPIVCEDVMNVPAPLYDPDMRFDNHDTDCFIPMGEVACFQNKCVFARMVAVGPEPI